MPQTIADLWYGNIAPSEHCGSHDPELNKLLILMERHKDSLHAIASPQQNEIFEKFIDCSEEYLILSMERAFCEGFCIAARLLTDALQSN